MNRRTCVFAVAALFISSAQLVSAHTLHFYTEMNAANENPSNPSLGTGSSHVYVDLDLLTMRVTAEFSGLTGTTTNAHIHCCVAPPGNVGVATRSPTFLGFPSGVTAGTYDHTYDMTLAGSYNAPFLTANGGSISAAFQALVDAMHGTPGNPGAYFNIHSSFRSGGEIRGFLTLIPEPTSAVLALVGLGIPVLLRRSR